MALMKRSPDNTAIRALVMDHAREIRSGETSKPGKPALAPGYQLRIEAVLAAARHIDVDLADAVISALRP